MRETLLTTCLLFYSILVLAQFGPQQIISDDAINPYMAIPLDIDNDGFVDVLKAVLGDHKLYWHKNLDGLGNFGEEILITDATALYLSIDFVDLDSDGDNDILYLENNPREAGWFENLDGLGNFSEVQFIFDNQPNFISNIAVKDIDNDGDLDIIAVLDNNYSYDMVWLENIDGMASFSETQYLFEFYPLDTSPLVVDIDHDGNLDILVSNNDEGPAKLSWYKNLGNVTFGPEQIIYQFDFIQTGWTSIHEIKITDINTDNFEDIVIISGNKDGFRYWWFENLDNLGNFGEKQFLSINIPFIPLKGDFCDVDNDGDIDVISGDSNNDRLYWIENSDGLGAYTTERNITTEIDFLKDFHSSDFNGDGILDVVSASLGDNKVAWYENTGVLGIPDNTENAIEVYPNPVNEKLFFTSIEAISVVDIFDSLGNKLQSFTTDEELDFSAFATGIYFIKITLDNGTTQVKKVLKE